MILRLNVLVPTVGVQGFLTSVESENEKYNKYDTENGEDDHSYHQINCGVWMNLNEVLVRYCIGFLHHVS